MVTPVATQRAPIGTLERRALLVGEPADARQGWHDVGHHPFRKRRAHDGHVVRRISGGALVIARHEFDYEALVRDVAESVPVILPTTTVRRSGDAIVAGRGIATVRFERCAPGEARVVFARNDAVDLDARVPISPSHADDVIADVVGYLIGASVGSLSLYPHHGTKPVLPARARSRRRTTTWDRERMTARGRGVQPAALALIRA